VRPLDLRALQVLVTVCESGNMTAAAKALGITQSAVSQHIHQLEEFVGTRLLDRTMRPIRPTPAGAVLAERGRRMLTEALTTTAIARRIGSEVLSELRVGIIASLSRVFLTQFVSIVSDRSGQPNLAIWSGLDLEHCEALLDRKLDMIISANAMQETTILERHELVKEQFIVIVPNGFAKDSNMIPPQKLGEALPLIRYSGRTLTGIYIEQHIRRTRMSLRGHLQFDSPNAIVETVADGRGWAIINPLDLLFASGDRKIVTPIPLQGSSLHQSLFLIARKDEYGKTPAHLANIARTILNDHYLPRIAVIEPWLAKCLTIQKSASARLSADDLSST
jgi:DNA-binding transcriptional LysR family regulator